MEMTTREVADKLGCHQQTVKRYCREHDIGRLVGRMRLLSAGDLAILRGMIRPRGCPLFFDPLTNPKTANR